MEKEDFIEKLKKRLDIVSSIALIICCIVFISFLVKNYLGSNKQNATDNLQTSNILGKKINIDNINWIDHQKNLLIVLNKNCHFCNESIPFYQRLTKEFSNQPNLRIIAVLPHSESENKQYLKDNSIEISEVVKTLPTLIGVQGTPTLILVDDSGVVREKWMGKLSTSTEDEIIKILKN